MVHVYCAGPLFNEAERSEMEAIAAVLERTGYTTFLPHRDGLEFAQLQPSLIQSGASEAEATRLVEEAIFALDAYMALNGTSAMVANLNGRVPDEGTLIEAAWAWRSGKPLVLYKADVRSLFFGVDNPLLRGLAEFELVTSIDDIPGALRQRRQPLPIVHCSRGEMIQKLRKQHGNKLVLATVLLEKFREGWAE